ncbi:MAG TPA: amino acid permease C-terminal domain-containing protein [Mycobacterium sp.]|nr:amino acid permease C-terminal domain-containing protein [Mycobacterium sp.]
MRFAVWMLLGIGVYLAYGRRHSLQGVREARQADTEPTRHRS